MKKATIIIVALAILALGVIAGNQWPSRLRVINNTDGWVIISMEYPYSWLAVPAGGDSEFHIEKGVYDALVTACGKTVSGKMNLESNLKLNFTQCQAMADKDSAKYLGEPSQEKPNWNRSPNNAEFRFQY